MNSRNPVYSFGDCRLDLERGALTRGSGDVSLRPKPFLVLQYFLEHPGRLIPKSELMHAVWPDAFVTDDSLVQCLSEIRRAIGDEQQTAIKTVPRRGYLFSLPVTIERDQTVSPPTERPAPSLRLKRWHLITASLVVIAGTISAWLWLRSQTAPTAVGTTSLEARDLYQRGRYLLDRQTPADSLLAVDYMQRATVVDPSFALASVGLSEAYNRLHMHGTCRPSECMPKAREAARRAIELAPNLGEAYAMRALVQTGYDFDHASAEQSFDRARALAPDSRLVLGYYASFLATQGRFNESIQLQKRLLVLDRTSPVLNRGLVFQYYAARQFDDAIAQGLKTLELHPTASGVFYWLQRAYEQKGQYDKAFEMWVTPFTVNEKNRAFVDAARQAFSRDGWDAYVRAELDERFKRMAESRRWTDLVSLPSQEVRTAATVRPWVNPYGVAAMYVRLGNTELALEWLEKAYEERTWYLLLLKAHAEWDPLRGDPRFRSILERLNLD